MEVWGTESRAKEGIYPVGVGQRGGQTEQQSVPDTEQLGTAALTLSLVPTG